MVFLKKMFYVALFLFVIFYIFYQVTGFSSDELSVMTARYSTAETIYSFDAYLFRDEKILTSSNSGVAEYLINDGEYASVDTELVRVYNSEGDKQQLALQIEKLEAQKALLEKSNPSQSSLMSDTLSAERSAQENYLKLLEQIYFKNYEDAVLSADNFLVSVNCLKVFLGSPGAFSNRISLINEQLQELKKAYSGSFDVVKNQQSGYFFKSVDGFEDLFSYDMIQNASLFEFIDLFSYADELTPKVSDNIAGKLINNHIWYIAIPVSYDDAKLFKDGVSYDVQFLHNDNLELEMTHYKTLSSETESVAVVILSCTNIPQGFDYRRMQSVRITLSEDYGFRVPTNAIRTLNGETGVYILRKSKVTFKKVSVIVEKNGFSIVKITDETDENYYDYIKLNDCVIIDGENLYDGKVVG